MHDDIVYHPLMAQIGTDQAVFGLHFDEPN